MWSEFASAYAAQVQVCYLCASVTVTAVLLRTCLFFVFDCLESINSKQYETTCDCGYSRYKILAMAKVRSQSIHVTPDVLNLEALSI
jgi:hypothetical protein